MDDKKLEELKQRFMQEFPVEMIATQGKPDHQFTFHNLDHMHSYSCYTARHCFNHFRSTDKSGIPALFLIPYSKSLVTNRGKQLIEMGRKGGVLLEEGKEYDRQVITVACNFGGNLSKDMACSIIGGMLHDFSATFYSFISEAWMVKAGKDSIPLEETPMPSVHPDKKEILMINTCSEVAQIMTHIDIVDNKLGKPERQDSDLKTGHGRFSNLFREVRAQSRDQSIN
tara:strand:- start:49 stop:729 length:681 start_codon:yes stop_codon:yes gene_type:complete